MTHYHAVDKSKKESIRMFTILLDDTIENLNIISQKKHAYFCAEIKEALSDLNEFLFNLMSEEEQKEKFDLNFLKDLLREQQLHSLLNAASVPSNLTLVFEIEEKIQDVIDYLSSK